MYVNCNRFVYSCLPACLGVMRRWGCRNLASRAPGTAVRGFLEHGFDKIRTIRIQITNSARSWSRRAKGEFLGRHQGRAARICQRPYASHRGGLRAWQVVGARCGDGPGWRHGGRSMSLATALVQHYDELVHHLRRRFGDQGFAREVVHDVCVRILAEPPQEVVHTPQAFLRRLSVDLAIDRHRVEVGRRAWVESVADLPEAEAPGASPEAQHAVQQALAALTRAIENLPPRCRDVFILHKLHDVPQEEIAIRLGISRNMVAQHIMRAMHGIRPVLQATLG